MKYDEQIIKYFDAVKYMREERNKIDKLIENMSKEEILIFFANKRQIFHFENNSKNKIDKKIFQI